MKPVSKAVNRPGSWVEKVTKAQILQCGCGVKYIKTRDNQTTCIKCLAKLREQA